MKKIKIIYNSIIPFKGYCAITVFNCIFARNEYKEHGISERTINHESIHMAQSMDFGINFCGYFIFYIWYLLEWIFKLPSALFGYAPYRSISFEQEAFVNEDNFEYLKNRKRFEWTKYLFKCVKNK